MIFTVSLNDDALKDGANPVTRIAMRRYSSRPLRIQFKDGGFADLLDTLQSVLWSVKEVGDYLGEDVVSAVLEVQAAPLGAYSGVVSYDNDALDALFLNGDGTQKASINLIGELTWAFANGNVGKSQVVTIALSNALSLTAEETSAGMLREDGTAALREDGSAALLEESDSTTTSGTAALREDGTEAIREDGETAISEE